MKDQKWSGRIRYFLSFVCIFALYFFIFSLCASFVSAEEVLDSPTPSPVSISYQLPYPGMLPDNPLYFLKVIRDGVWSFLLSNPLKKADFDLLQADKRV